MNLTKTQKRMITEQDSHGVHLDPEYDEPCECGPHNIETEFELGYSDTGIYHHRCTCCKSHFVTYTEG